MIDTLTVTQITEHLKHKSDNTFDLGEKLANTDYRKASVLIPFVWQDNAWHILFIRRAESDKDRHSGQVAFVGGKAEISDSSEIETALRETQEEIGVNPKDVNVLGHIGFHYSVSCFEITPVIGILPWPYDLTPDPAEVSHTFAIPLAWLADETNHHIKYRQAPESERQIPVVYFNQWQGELLWGATARMILSLINCLKQK